MVGAGNNANPGATESFRWTSGGMASLGFLPGGSYSKALGVSADGSIVVGYGDSDNAIYEAYRWTSGGMASLGLLPGGTISLAQGVNADGSVVVGYGDSTNAAQVLRHSAGHRAAWLASASCREEITAEPLA